MSGKSLKWILYWIIPAALLLAQIAIFIYYARPVGYPVEDARIAVWEIYSQLSENPNLDPAIQEIREIAQEHGHAEGLIIERVSTARRNGLTTIELRVIRSKLSYEEEVIFNHDGTIFKINSALSTHAIPF